MGLNSTLFTVRWKHLLDTFKRNFSSIRIRKLKLTMHGNNPFTHHINMPFHVVHTIGCGCRKTGNYATPNSGASQSKTNKHSHETIIDLDTVLHMLWDAIDAFVYTVLHNNAVKCSLFVQIVTPSKQEMHEGFRYRFVSGDSKLLFYFHLHIVVDSSDVHLLGLAPLWSQVMASSRSKSVHCTLPDETTQHVSGMSLPAFWLKQISQPVSEKDLK